MVILGEILRHQVASAMENRSRERALIGALRRAGREIAALIDDADFGEITTKEFDAYKRCHYIVLKELKELGLLDSDGQKQGG